MARVEVDLRRVADEIARGPVEKAVRLVLLAGEREAKQRCPRDTGNLAASIGTNVEVDGTRVVGILGTNVEYAAPVEFGTHSAGEPDAPGKVSHAPGGMPPRPYLRPGLQAGIAFGRSRGIIT